MSDFKAKMYQIRFLLGLHPKPRWGSLQGEKGREGGKGGKEGVAREKSEA